jgi:putative phosphoesterase
MKIGILSDIHGDLEPLNAALTYLQRERVDLIVCAGDLVDFGLYNDEVVERIYDLGIPCVQGNHDRLSEERQALRRAQIENGMRVKLLKDETIQRLIHLPTQLRYTWEGVSVLLVHTNPWESDTDYIAEKSMPALLRRVVETSEADITIVGHTHAPIRIEVEDKLILNPGSVSINYTCLYGTCGVLSLPSREFRILNLDTGEWVEVRRRVV